MTADRTKRFGVWASALADGLRDGFDPQDLHLEHLLYRGRKTEVYSAVGKNGQRYVVKRLCAGEQNPVNIAQLRHEYELLDELDGCGVRPVIGFSEVGGVTALILADLEGQTFHELLPRNLTLRTKLIIAERWARALAELHIRGVVHRDVNPANVLIGPDLSTVHIIDLGIAQRMNRGQTMLPFEAGIVGTIDYLAPEQSGRLNQGFDERLDLYGLGASFYEVFTGRPPFSGREALEIIHAHLTQMPQEPHEVNPDIPRHLSRLVMRLLAKNPAERYLGSLGIAADLAEMIRMLDCDATAKDGDFVFGRYDIRLRFAAGTRLYGRGEQRVVLEQAWKHVAGGKSALLTVQGVSGSGKSSLIHAMGVELWQGKAWTATGKYEIFGRDMAYDGLVQVARQLIKNIQSDQESLYKQWLDRITSSLVINGSLIADLIPELVDLVPFHERPMDLSPKEAQARIQNAFMNLFSSFSSLGKHIVVFLDDLQWADISSLELISIWAREAHPHTLIIGAYRQEDLNSASVLPIYINDWRQHCEGYSQITVGPIEESAVTEWCQEVLHWNRQEAQTLASVVHQRSHGNPLFVRQILQKLYRDGLLYVSLDQYRWCADLAAIQLISMSDHVISLLLSRLKSLSTDLQRILACASFFGTQFSLKMLSSALGIREETVSECLNVAISEELILRVGEVKQDNSLLGVNDVNFRFLHDRIIEASQTLLSDYEVLELRLALARFLIGKRQSVAEFSVVLRPLISQAIFHCMAACSLLFDPDEKHAIAVLACDAADRAQGSAAWKIAADLYRGGREILGDLGTNNHRDLSRRLRAGEGSCAMLAGMPDAAKVVLDQLLSDSRSDEEIAEIQSLRCRLYTSIERYSEAIKAGIDGLRVLGEWRGTTKIGVARGAWEAYKCQKRVVALGREKLLELPMATDPRQLLVARIIAEIAPPAMLTQQYLAIVIACKQVDTVVNSGYSRYSVLSFLSLVMAINGASAVSGIKIWTKRSPDLLLEMFDSSEQQLSLDRQQVERRLVYHCFVSHWREDFRESPNELIKLVPLLIEFGNVAYVAVAMLVALDLGMFLGQNVINLLTATSGWEEFVEQKLELRDRNGLREFKNLLSMMSEKGVDEVLTTLQEMEYSRPSRDSDLAYTAGMTMRHGAFLTIFRRYDLAYKSLMAAIRYGLAKRQAGNYKMGVLCFYLAIACIETSRAAGFWQRLIRQGVYRAARYMISVYAEINSTYWQHKLIFIDAISLLQNGKNIQKACRMIESAIELAQKRKSALDEGCMAEYLGRFWFEPGNFRVAAGLLVVARDAFERCGFLAKAREIDALLQQCAVGLRTMETRTSDRLPTIETNGKDMSLLFDVPTLTRASLALSREIDLGKLKSTLLSLLVENAGARGAAILWRLKSAESHRKAIQIVAYRSVQGVCSDEEVALDDAMVSLRVLAYVERTGTQLIVSDVDRDSIWKHDLSLRSRGAKSVLCVPIMVAGEQNGAIYLENDLLENAFSPERVEILKILAGQVAISLDNASLYQQLSSALSAEQTARREERAAHEAFVAAESARSKLQAGVEAADAVQKALVDVRQMASNYEVSYLYESAEMTGGDWLTTFYDTRRSWVYLCLGDVTGHGVPAALITAAVAGAAASTVSRIAEGDYRLVEAVDEMMKSMDAAVKATRDVTSQLMTMVIVGIDLTTGKACYVNAGHQPIICLGRDPTVILEGGNPLGFQGSLCLGRRQFELSINDVLVLYSDGLVENMSVSGERLKLNALRRLAKKHTNPPELIDLLRDYVGKFAKDASRDDAACLVFRWLGPSLMLKVG